jgi:hypothetical protein
VNQGDRAIVTSMILLLLVLWGGFLVHRSPEFAGSTAGGFFGVAGAMLMVVASLPYSLVRRIASVRRATTPHLSMRVLLTLHVYLGLGGVFLALIHSGHKFQSALGMALTTVMLLVVLTGYVGRYLLNYIGADALENRAVLAGLRSRLETSAAPMAPAMAGDPFDRAGFTLRMIGAMADVEHAVAMEERLRALFRRWVVVHIGLSIALYVLLALHVWAGVEFGLRWFR